MLKLQQHNHHSAQSVWWSNSYDCWTNKIMARFWKQSSYWVKWNFVNSHTKNERRTEKQKLLSKIIFSNSNTWLSDGSDLNTYKYIKIYKYFPTFMPRRSDSCSAFLERRVFPAFVTKTVGILNRPLRSSNNFKASDECEKTSLPRTNTPSMSNMNPKFDRDPWNKTNRHQRIMMVTSLSEIRRITYRKYESKW